MTKRFIQGALDGARALTLMPAFSRLARRERLAQRRATPVYYVERA